jgi:hypothetical protein
VTDLMVYGLKLGAVSLVMRPGIAKRGLKWENRESKDKDLISDFL